MVATGSCGNNGEREGGKEKMCKDRYSMPFFAVTNSDTLIECLPGCWGEGREKRYEAIIAGEYVRMRMEALY